jgi:type IX secretion system PorP/SprF family membrane protein
MKKLKTQKAALRQWLIMLMLLTIVVLAKAQQDAGYTMYRNNGLYLNPGYTGSREALSVVTQMRYQWVGVPGAPQTASLGVHAPLPYNAIALGVLYTYDRITRFQQHDVQAFFAYRLTVGKKKDIRLSFGIQAGVKNMQANLQSAVLPEVDPQFVNSSLWLPAVGAGVYVYSQRFFAGVSCPNILANSLNRLKSQSGFTLSESIARQYHQLLFSGGYQFQFGKKVQFTPSVLVRYIPRFAPVTADFNVAFIFIERIAVGAGYRINDSYQFNCTGYITRQLRLGYAYDLTISALSPYTSGSHEIMLGYDFRLQKKEERDKHRFVYF